MNEKFQEMFEGIDNEDDALEVGGKIPDDNSAGSGEGEDAIGRLSRLVDGKTVKKTESQKSLPLGKGFSDDMT